MTPLLLDGSSLTLEATADVARGGRRVRLAPAATAGIEAGAELVARIVADGRRTYGVNTGFGALSTVTIGPGDLGRLQLNLLRSHAAGVGEPFPEAVVRAMLLLRANTLARGHSGVRTAVIERLLDLLAERVHPVVPCQGSVGASGDLAPLAHLALALVGEGEVDHRGARTTAADAHARLGWTPLTLGPKEGLALINGTQASAAVGTLALIDAERLLLHADLIGAVSLEALRGRPAAFDERLHALRPIEGQRHSAANLRRLLAGSRLTTLADDALQDAYALRCMPQVHGASRETVGLARRILAIEVNAVTDNPLVFPLTGEVISGGNFHGEPLAQALDALAIGIASLAAMSERRLDRLVSGGPSGLPRFLAKDEGLHSGFMIAQVTAAALVAENRVLAHPASVDSIPTSAGKEDHVSFSTHAARKAASVVMNTAHVLAAELLAAAQALDFRGPTAASPAARAVHARLRAVVASLDQDRVLAPDLARARELIESGALLEAVDAID